MRNLDTEGTGHVRKRTGYQGKSGYIPLRAAAFDVVGDLIEVTLDSGVNLISAAPAPIVLHGSIWVEVNVLYTITTPAAAGITVMTIDRAGMPGDVDPLNIKIGSFIRSSLFGPWKVVSLSTISDTQTVVGFREPWPNGYANGSPVNFEFLTEDEYYFETFGNQAIKELVADTTTQVSIPNALGSIATIPTVAIIGKASEGRENKLDTVIPGSVLIDNAELAYEFELVGPDSEQAILYVEDQDLPGMSKYSISGVTEPISGSVSVVIDHGLPNLNFVIGTSVQVGGGITPYEVVIPSSVILSDTGILTVTFDASGDVLFDGDLIWNVVVYDVPGNYHQEQVVPSGTSDIVFNNIDSELTVCSVYLRNEALNQTEIVIPDSITVDIVNKTLTICVTTPDSGVLQLNYIPGFASANSIHLDMLEYDDNPTYPNKLVTTDTPQLNLYGIRHSDIIYDSRGGHVHGLGEFSNEGNNEIVAALGGVLYSESTVHGDPITLPARFITLSSFSIDQKYVGPFFNSVDTGNLSRGIVDANISDNNAIVVSVTPDHNTGTAAVVLDLTAPSDIVIGMADLGVDDIIRLVDTGSSHYDGEFNIVSASGSTIIISAPDVPDHVGVYSNLKGTAYIDTNQIDIDDTQSESQVGDILNSTLFVGFNPVITGRGTNSIIIQGISSESRIPGGATLTASRLTSDIPVDDVSWFVIGDTVDIDNYGRQFQITGIDTVSNTISVDEVIEVRQSSTDSSVISVSGRWTSVESPLGNDSRFSHFNANAYIDQPRIQSATINESVFFNNYDDVVMKYDGANIYRAGLPAWQPHTHTWVDTSSAAEKIIMPSVIYNSTSVSGGIYTVEFTSVDDMPDILQTIYFEANGGISAGEAVVETKDESSLTITVDKTLTAETGGVLYKSNQVAYYFKLQAYDRNNNIVASSVTDYRDCIVNVFKSCTIYHKFSSMPRFDVYDYDRIDLMVYRTKITETAIPPFYLVKRHPIDFGDPVYESRTDKQIDSIIIKDTTPDLSLSSIPDDTSSIALKGAELPLATTEPVRAKYMESVSNRMVLGNVRGQSSLDMSFLSQERITTHNMMEGSLTSIWNGIDDELKFRFVRPWYANNSEDTDTTHVAEVQLITFKANSTQVEIDMHPTESFSLELSDVGKWIQFEAYSTDAHTDIDFTPAHLVGWHQIVSIEATGVGGDFIIETNTYNDGGDIFWAPGANDASYRVAMITDADDEIPIFAWSHTNDPGSPSVDKLTFKDQLYNIDNTTATRRATIDLRDAFNRVMISQTSPWALARVDSNTTDTVKFQSTDPAKTLSITFNEGNVAALEYDNYDLEVYINQIRALDGIPIARAGLVYPSRLLLSAPAFPEMFDNPYAIDPAFSDSIIDVNANDGQEITGISSFFAIGSSTAAAVEETLIVFKNRSVYAVSIQQKSIRKLESLGQGCTIPDSISSAQDGIIFANASGIYKVTRGLTVDYVGRWVQDYWRNEIDFNTVATEAFGFTDTLERKYKLSVPTKTSNEKNDDVVVFDYITEGEDATGAWTFYDNFKASIWHQTNTITVFGDYTGRIMALRSQGDETDFRDDSDGITSTYIYSAQAFGDTGTRSVVDGVISHFKAETVMTNTAITMATDMENDFKSAGTIEFNADDKKLQTLDATPPVRHCLFLQVKYVHTTKDENFILGGIDFKVQTLTSLGIKQTTN